ncbi:hypothetical protein ZIOFF_060945 [Zingiber officinale]|uniref:Uncharacterized protein n=1 Tax=Zingiber officinale TaxID=94328 RepID=A0A8J5FC63_ZINOF|nr:hypothetical protein ZIOFF_060945 [Zingiber officinale]
MKGRGGNGGNVGAPADLLVCFPSRAHLALMPKPICSPSRPADLAGKRHRAARGHVSPLFKTKTKSMSSEEVIDEPTSPKVTCAGQIKVRSKSRPRPPPAEQKNWIAVVEEIERMHEHRNKKAHHWLDAVSLKKDVMHLVGALRGFRFNMRCFGAFHGAVDCTTDEEDGEEEEEEEDEKEEAESSTESGTVFSKWFMLLEENQRIKLERETEEEEEEEEEGEEEEKEEQNAPPTNSSVPPPNALMLMRCRSAPAKGWLKRRESGGEEEEIEAEEASSSSTREKEKEEKLVLMSYAPDFFKISTDIARETWVAGSADPLARSRSWRR